MTDEITTTAERVRALRQALRMTQEDLAERSGIARVLIPKMEAGTNQASSFAMQEALARGCDVPLEAFHAYLVGEIPLPALLALRGLRAASDWWRPIAAAAVAKPAAAHVEPGSAAKKRAK